MQAVSRNTTARNMAAEMASSLGGQRTSATTNGYTVHDVTPASHSFSPGESVEMDVVVEHSQDSEKYAFFDILLDGEEVDTWETYIPANTRYTVPMAMEYEEALNAVGSEGDYTLSMDVTWREDFMTQSVSDGTVTLESSSSGYSVNGFAPTAAQVTKGDTVQFITNVTNNYQDVREAQFFVKLGGSVVATETKSINATETRDVAQTVSYSDLKTVVGSDGDYTLSVEVHWPSGDVQQTQTWGSITLGSSDSNDEDNNNNDNTTPTTGIPKKYLLAGGGGLFFLFALVLLA